MSLLKNLHAMARPGFCSCGDPLPPKRGTGRKPKLCLGCQASYQTIYGQVRHNQEPEVTLRKIRKLERLAAALVARAVRTLERAP